MFVIFFRLLEKAGKIAKLLTYRRITSLILSICVAGPDGMLLHCGTDQDRRCELFSSLDLSALRQHRSLEHDGGLQMIVEDSVDVCVVVITSPSPDTTTMLVAFSLTTSSALENAKILLLRLRPRLRLDPAGRSLQYSDRLPSWIWGRCERSWELGGEGEMAGEGIEEVRARQRARGWEGKGEEGKGRMFHASTFFPLRVLAQLVYFAARNHSLCNHPLYVFAPCT